MNISISPKINFLFILLGLFSALNEAANLGMSVVQKIRTKMPIYAAIYDKDDKWDKDDSDKLEKIWTDQNGSLNNAFSNIDAQVPINTRPFLRSPLHRAIEKMNSGAVEWLVNKNAFLYYGFFDNKEEETKEKNTDPEWILLDPKDRGDKSPHLIGHLEEYFDEKDQKKINAAKIIMKHLYSARLDIGAWPVKNLAFKQARIDFYNENYLDINNLKDDESIKLNPIIST